MDVPFFALMAHDKARFKTHVCKRLVEMPRHTETCAAAHPGIDIVLVAIVEFARAGGAPRLFQTDDFRQILVGDVRDLIAEVHDLFHVFGSHRGMRL